MQRNNPDAYYNASERRIGSDAWQDTKNFACDFVGRKDIEKR